MIDGRALTAEQADQVWTILVDRAGAGEAGREEFVFVQTRGRCDEYRFIGGLGFGGKFWTSMHGPRWYVTAYREDCTPERQRMIDDANAALAGLRASYEALDAVLAEPGQETP